MVGDMITINQKATGQRMSDDLKSKVVGAMKALRDGNRAFASRYLQPYEHTIATQGLDRNAIIGDLISAPSGTAGAVPGSGGAGKTQNVKILTEDDL